jgi:Cu/Ag efflux pump CusA
MLRVRVDRDRCARYGIPVGDVLDTIEAARAGREVGAIFRPDHIDPADPLRAAYGL